MHSPAASTYSLASTSAVDRVVILYASETGNAQDTAERVGREFRRRGRAVTLLSMDMFDITELPHVPLLILITSTHGRGDPPPAMKPLWEAMLRANLPEDVLEDVHFSLFGLGDSSYERFAYAGKLLHRRLLALGANPLIEPAWGDERAPEGIEETLLPWLDQTLEAMLPHLPQPEGLVERSTTELPEPIYRLDWEPPEIDGHELDVPDGEEPAPSREVDRVNELAGETWKPKDWNWARLRTNRRVSAEGWWQEVREVELEFEDANTLPYPPGSIANLQPRMSPEEVDSFLDIMSLSSQADLAFRIHSAVPDQPLPPHLPPENQITTLRSLLTNHLDLRQSPRKSFFEWLRRLSPDEREQERLDEFITDPDEVHNYATRPSRTILETLADFRHTRIPASHLIEILPPLRRRQFSIASSWDSHPGKVQLLIAMVEYKTNLAIPRRGLCSSWLQDLPLETRIPLKISPPTLVLPPLPSTPVILVGPGTGVAPMRAFVEERVRQGAAKDTMLYFGCRSRTADHYFAEEWEAYRKLGVKIRVAVSREGPEKVYVQHLIREDKELIKDWMLDRQGWLYVCGSSNAMPREVREAVAWGISRDGSGGSEGRDEEGAKAYVDAMFDEGRGGEESW